MKRPPREGFILISVLGALIVLASLVGAVSYLARTAVMGAAAARERLAVDALLRSGVELAGYELFMLRRPAAAVNRQRIRLDDGVVTLFVTAESGKVDLNGSSPQLLAGLWAAIGAPGLRPDIFAARVLDYRDADGDPSPNDGAEAPQYAAAGPNRVPADAPFEQVDELQNVLGVSAAAVATLMPLVTVHNPGGKLSLYEAPPAALRALPGGVGVAERAFSLRSRAPEDASEALGRALGDAAQFVALDPVSPAFSVRVEVERGGARRSADLILTASLAPEALYFVTDKVERSNRAPTAVRSAK